VMIGPAGCRSPDYAVICRAFMPREPNSIDGWGCVSVVAYSEVDPKSWTGS